MKDLYRRYLILCLILICGVFLKATPNDLYTPHKPGNPNSEPQFVFLKPHSAPNAAYCLPQPPDAGGDRLIEYRSPWTDSDIESRVINQSLPFGRTIGSQSVNPAGGASYNIQVALPPGTNGVIPSLAIAYNSLAGNGHLGMGWNIGGLSQITRGNRDIYNDGYIEVGEHLKTDAYYFNGQRLKHISGTYGTGNSTYGTENETFSKITGVGSTFSGPAWFKVETQDGTTFEYGNNNATTNSLFHHSNGTVLVWALSKIRDCNGNYIEFIYTDLGAEQVISEIRYTGNSSAGLSPYNKILFHYEERSDKNTHYVKGYGIKTNHLLEEIEIRGEGNQLFKRYQFNYSYTEGHSLLRELTEIGSNGSTFNSTIFKYGNTPTGVTFGTTTAGQGDAKETFTGDFNGDGYSDMLQSNYAYSNGYKYHTGYKVFYNNGTSGTTFTLGPTGTFGGAVQTKYYGYNNLLVSDYNGDALDDILITKLHNSGGYNRLDYVEKKLSNYGSNSFSTSTIPHPPSYDIIHPSMKFFYPGDYDGDGKLDYITLLSNGSSYKAFLSLEGGADPNHEVTVPGGSATGVVISDAIYVVDFDGDGKNELMIINDLTTFIYTIEKNGSQYKAVQLYSSGFPTKYHTVRTGDFNGDGKTDLLTKSGASWQVSYSNGVNFSSSSFNPTVGIDPSSSSQHLRIGDFNGDGMSDILHAFNVFSGGIATNSTIKVYLSNGKSFVHQQLHSSAPLLGAEFTPGDFNGDGRLDIVQQTYYASPMDIFFLKPNGTERLLEKVSDGYAFVTEFRYKLMTKGGSFYKKGSSSPYPMVKISSPLNMAERMIIPDGIGGLRTTYYSYEGALLHQQGKGFVGFQKFISKDYDRDYETTVDFEQNTTYYASAMKKETQKHISNGDMISETDYTNNFDPLSAGRFWIRTSYISRKDHVHKHRNTTTLSFNSNGVLTQKKVNIGLPLSSYNTPHEYVQEDYSNFASMCTGIAALPQTVTVTKIRNGGTAVTKTTKNYYSSVTGLYKTIDFFGTPEAVTTEHTSYHAHFGNVMGTEVSSPGLPTQVVGVTYDSKGRFPVTETNALGQTESRSFHPLWGTQTSVTTIDGLTTAYGYDPFGRISTITNPLGQTRQITSHWDLQSGSGTGTVSVSNALYHTVTTIPGFPDSQVYYDIYDRVRENRKVGYGGQWIKDVTSYDKLGRVRSTTTPFYNSGSAVVNTHTYDDYDRPTSAGNSSGTTNYFYTISGTNLVKGVIHLNGMVTNTVHDAAGKVLSATDNGGTLNYEYDSFGNNTKVSLDGNTLVTMTYDPVYGRQTSTVDIDAGTNLYQYNAYDQLVSETDGNGNTHVMTYDVIGRMLTKTGPEGTVTYDYVTSGNGLNKLKKQTGFNGLTKEYAYDSYNRIQKISVPYLSAFSTTFSYDGYGRKVNTIYSTDVQIMKNYDASGYVEKIYSVENDIVNQQSVLVTLFEAQSMNAFEKYTQFDAGNGITSYVSYDDFGYPTFYNGGNGAVQYLQLDWDNATGNLKKRTDHIKNKSETFTYDSMDRLFYSYIAGGPSLNTTFDPNGNIDWHSNVEHMQYFTTFDDSRVRKIANPNTDISLETQEISYTPFNEVNEIDEGDFNLKFNYGPDHSRMQSILKENGNVSWVRGYVPEVGYESIIENNTKKHLHYIRFGDKLGVIIIRCDDSSGGGGGGGGELPVGHTPEGGDPVSDPGPDPVHEPAEWGCTDDYNYFYTYCDHLGSILTVTNEYGNVIGEQSFDAWGRYRDPDNWNYISAPSGIPSWLIRGFTGHEKLDEFELIHMNGRLYAPKTSRMINADNFVQDELNTQSYNRYSYALNNPVKYTDPSGEFIGTAFTFLWDLGDKVFTEGAIDPTCRSCRQRAWRDFDPTRRGSKTNNAWRIDRGLFEGNAGQIFTRLTWELPQTVIGNLSTHVLNVAGMVNDVNYFRGATVIDSDLEGGAYTAGTYIVGPEGFRPDFRDHLFVHEYGHYIQSRIFGPFYFTLVALPSVTDFWLVDELFGEDLHDTRWYETHANRLTANYFDREFGAGADGYFPGSINHFDRNSFENAGVWSPYTNPRNGGRHGGGNPTVSRFHWTDIPINLIFNGGIGLLGYL